MMQLLGTGELRFARLATVRVRIESGQAEVDKLDEWPTALGGRSGDDHEVGRLNGAMGKPVKASGTQRADYLEGDSQNRIKRHRAVRRDPRIKRLTLQIFRDEDEVVIFDSESRDFRDV